MNKIEAIKHPEFDKIKNIKYGFLTRNGGVSTGEFKSLNTKYKTKDNPQNIKKNKQIIAEYFKLKTEYNLIRPYQIHSTEVLTLKTQKDIDLFKTNNFDKIPKYDAIVTKLKNILIGVSTADCIPLLLVDEINQIIGAAHLGWKGALNGIIKNTIDAMLSIGAKKENIKSVIGPCIRQKSYEIDQKFYDNFLKENKNNKKFFINSTKQNHYLFDLPFYAKEKLQKNKIKYIYDVNLDTYTNPKKFFSYRRSCHQGNKEKYGIQFSGIILT